MMKPATAITPANSEEERLRGFDLREIDAPDPRGHFTLKYWARLKPVLDAVEGYVEPPGLVLEAGCSQANASLLLAERGYRCVALDIMPEALGYARKKHERGVFLPLCASVDAPPIRPGSCDAVIAGELLEHCADPVDILRRLAACLREGGVLVLTTPNGARWGSREPTYAQVSHEEIAPRQFGPGGEHHLFAFTLPELLRVVRKAGLTPLEVSRHGSLLHSDRLMLLKRAMAAREIRALADLACRLPLIGSKTALTLLVVATPTRPA